MDEKSLHDRYAMPAAAAEQRARETLEKCMSLKVSPNPIHYTLLFEYLAETDPELREEIAHTLQLHAYDDKSAEELYLKLIARMTAEMLPTGEAETLFERLRDTLDAWLDDFSSEQQSLKEDIRALKATADAGHCTPILEMLERHILPRLARLENNAFSLTEQVNGLHQQFDRLRHQFSTERMEARTDPLSGLLNRRGLMERLLPLIDESTDLGQTFSIILLDIDHFKRINDTFGHVVGDSVIRYLARILKNETKGQDILARIGGEEFVIILPQTPYDGAVRVAQKIRTTVERKKLAVKLNNQPLQFTISAGVAVYQLGEAVDTLFERADKALYRAKEKGRNRVCGEESR